MLFERRLRCEVHVYAFVLAVLQSAFGAHNGSQFSRASWVQDASLVLPASAPDHLCEPPSKSWTSGSPGSKGPDIDGKVKSLRYNFVGPQKVRRPLHIGQMERVGRMTDRVRRLFTLPRKKTFQIATYNALNVAVFLYSFIFFSSFDPSRSLPRLRICWTQLKTTETWFT